MSMTLKKFALAAATASALSAGALALTTVPAAAHVVCDRDGDDCWETHPRYWDRGWDRDWYERREWEERREREARRQWYWSHRPYYYGDPGYGGGSVWFNFR